MTHAYHPHCGCSQCCDIEDSEDDEGLADEMAALLEAARNLEPEL